MRQCALFLLLIVFASPRLVAQTVTGNQPYDPSLFRALKWRNVGPDRAGRSIACAGNPSRPFEYYAGAVGGGLWKTTDGGTTWRPVTDGQINSSSVGAVAVSESHPDVVYIGMGEMQIQRNMLQGDGVYKSTDAGATWRHIGLEGTQVISRIRVHPRNPDLVYAAAFGHPYGTNEERGVYRSTDGGKSWQRILFRDNPADQTCRFRNFQHAPDVTSRKPSRFDWSVCATNGHSWRGLRCSPNAPTTDIGTF